MHFTGSETTQIVFGHLHGRGTEKMHGRGTEK